MDIAYYFILISDFYRMWTMQVLIVDDHPLYIRGLQTLISDMQPSARLLSAKSLRQAVQLLSQHEPDLILLDVHLPDANGIEALQCLKQQRDSVPIVLISADEDSAQIIRSIEAGAAGYIPKQTEPELMIHALELVLAQGTYLPPGLLGSLTGHDHNPLPDLSSKQRLVLQKLLQGKSNKVIARELCLAEGTIKAHLWAVYQLLGVNSRLQAMAKAHQLGLITSVTHASL